jgi:hypothetical protein
MELRALGEKSKIWGRGEEADVALWDPRVGKENRGTVEQIVF